METGWRGRVLLLLGSSTGGIGQHVAALARGLAAAGARVTVCAPAATAARLDLGGAAVVPVEIPASPRPADLRAVGALRAAVRAARPQVLHAHGLRAGFVAAAARTGVPLVVTWHNAALSRGPRALAHAAMERAVARSAAVTLGASADLVARARACGARDARPGPVAAPPLPPPGRPAAAVRAACGVPADAPLLLSVGRLHPQKRYDVLVAAAARWRDLRPAPAVLVAGDGPSLADLTARIGAAQAPVHLLGHRGDVADLLGAADLAVVTSAWEARQLFAQEALRVGLPLVATDVGGIPELVGDAAVLVPPGDVDALDTAVRDLLADPARRAALAAAGRARAATWPTQAQMLAQVVGVYAALAAGRP
ncbi:glycosyl transferase [Pilimelia terevasa]|uniref:Glycosyl transferase n=1 Tax=Pilimelia terevasa TaxID=53372 RepID=A0A8J3BP25_9ACTN|nr:glycosyltransferase family 4 protein [Pilimelia terevasa]GGK36999.1 glycosyl transferase [Pilimelia terevasa]